jgi:arginine vasopressin receptor 1A
LSSYVLMATAVDRHQAICYPLTYCSWTSRRSKVMVYLAWITSLVFCIPQVSVFRRLMGEGRRQFRTL